MKEEEFNPNEYNQVKVFLHSHAIIPSLVFELYMNPLVAQIKREGLIAERKNGQIIIKVGD